MPVVTYGVTPDSVRRLYFPHLDAPGANTVPSLSTQETIIAEESAELYGRLLREAVDAQAVGALGPTEAPYLWCAKTLGLMAAVRIAEASTHKDYQLLQAWRATLKARFEALRDDGATALGDSSLEVSDSPVDGPTTHISQYRLTADSAADMSTTVPRLRKDDML